MVIYRTLLAFVVGVVILSVSLEVVGRRRGEEREGKWLSLFNVVNFKNDPCQTKVKGSAGKNEGIKGTCYSASDCSSKSGTPSGPCAAGFGVCCVFTVAKGTIKENNTYLQNPGYSSSTKTAGEYTYTIKKAKKDVCLLRLDFESFTLNGITDSFENSTCTDKFSISVSGNQQKIPEICGENSGQHMYIDLGSSSSAEVSITLDGEDEARKWNIQTSQISCQSSERPPNGCLQYLTSSSGSIESFGGGSSQIHLPNLDYSVCIRPEKGYCCVEYQVCSQTFTLGVAKADIGFRDNDCSLGDIDYIGIDQSSVECDLSGSSSRSNLYCGSYTGVESNVPICDCTQPFAVRIFTDDKPDQGDQLVESKGVCLNYRQVPCP